MAGTSPAQLNHPYRAVRLMPAGHTIENLERE